jgi:hypothetical protein
MREADKLAAYRNREQRREFRCVAWIVLTLAVAAGHAIWHIDAGVIAHLARVLGL